MAQLHFLVCFRITAPSDIELETFIGSLVHFNFLSTAAGPKLKAVNK